MITTTQDKAVQYINSEFQKIVDKEQAILNVLTKLNNKSMALTLLKVIQQQIGKSLNLLMITVKQLNRLNSP